MEFELTTEQDDWSLTSVDDLDRVDGGTYYFGAYLTDPDGNRLTDPDGNYLVSWFPETVSPQALHTSQDDWTLNDG